MRSMILVIGVIVFALASFPIFLSDNGNRYFLVVVLAIGIYFIWNLLHLLLAKKYKKVRAEIREYCLIEHKRYEESNIPSLDYEVSIAYTYEYNGRSYRSSKVGIDSSLHYFKAQFSFTDDEKAKTDALEYLNTFVNDPEPVAYVNPLYPREAVLDVNVSKNALALNVSYILIAAVIFVWLYEG